MEEWREPEGKERESGGKGRERVKGEKVKGREVRNRKKKKTEGEKK